MERVRIIVLKRDAEAVAEALGRLGMLELTGAPQQISGVDESSAADQEVGRFRELGDRAARLLGLLGIPEVDVLAGRPGAPVPLEDVDRLLCTLEQRTSELAARMDALDAQIEGAQDTMDQLLPYRELKVQPARLNETTFLHAATGDMPQWQIAPARQSLPSDALLVALGPPVEAQSSLRRVLALSSRRSRFALRTILEEHQFQEKELPAECDAAPAAVYESARSRRDAVQTQKDALSGSLLQVREVFQADLEAGQHTIQRALGIAEARRSFGATWATEIITGWAPRDQVERMRREVERVTEGRAVFESRPATREEIAEGRVPSYAPQPKLLRPFQRFVHAFGQPTYREVEPTFMFAVSFMLLFGVVFGDLGHGACLLAIGLITHLRARRADIKDVGYVIAAAGLSSVLFGTFFQGSLFGHSLKDMGFGLTLGLEPLRLGGTRAEAARDVLRYLALALALGIVMISLGLVLNIVNRFRRGDYEAGLLGRFGLAGLVLYWGLLVMVCKLAVAGARPADILPAVAFIGVPLVLLVFHDPIYALLTRRTRLWREGPLMGLFEGVVEAFEAVTGYLANTLSFLRVAAFAFSHAALAFTTFMLQRKFGRLPAGLLWSPLLFVAGTALIIGLEGLIVTIQILRLEYYEFFTKFFSGEGRKFHPFRLNQ